MQETINPQGERHFEFFREQTLSSLERKMKDRFEVLKKQGHSFVRRVQITQNEPCPCGSGEIFKNCCFLKCNENK